ncbi:MAG: hypothetical protein ABIH88_01955, partial [Patescibacteria group bacterium]
TLYFQIFPFLLVFFLGGLSFLVGFLWKKDFWTGFYLMFLNFFAGSFGFIVSFIRSGEIGGESLFWSMQSSSVLINPPFALSLVFILFGMLCLLRVRKWDLKKVLLVGLLFGMLINIKAYSGIVVLPALAFFAFFEKRGVWKVSLAAVIVSLTTFFIFNKNASSLFVFEPFWFIHTMIESTDRLSLPLLASARVNLTAQGSVFKLFLIEGFGLFVFIAGNMGTRIIGLASLVEKNVKQKFSNLDIFLIVGGAVGLLVPLLFVQKGTSWNTIQFFYYFLFFTNFYAAEVFSKLTRSKKIFAKIVLVILLLLTIPTTVSSLKGYFGWPPPAAISRHELEALKFLEGQESGVLLSQTWDPFKKRDFKTTPLPIYAYETTAYIPALTGMQSFLADEMNLIISDYDFKDRLDEQIKFFSTDDLIWQRGFLLNNKIDYLYLLKPEGVGKEKVDLGLKDIFENKEIVIYKVLK